MSSCRWPINVKQGILKSHNLHNSIMLNVIITDYSITFGLVGAGGFPFITAVVEWCLTFLLSSAAFIPSTLNHRITIISDIIF